MRLEGTVPRSSDINAELINCRLFVKSLLFFDKTDKFELKFLEYSVKLIAETWYLKDILHSCWCTDTDCIA